MKNKSVLMAMSGGVDSSVAALTLLKMGYTVEGATMRLYRWDASYRPKTRTCCTDRDLSDASEVAAALDIPYSIIDLEADFRRDVIDKFVRVYENGGTPNPCIDCNRYLKFDKLLEYAKSHSHDYIATGHYARIAYDAATGRYLLKRSADPSKDQTYVLYNLTQDDLSHTLFPLGDMTKEETRAIAREHELVNSEKADSQDICFIPDGDYAGFIERYKEKKYPEGSYLDTDGNIIGTHAGAIRYTIGQRKGLNVAFGTPMYVVDKDMRQNTVTLTPNESDIFRTTLTACDLNWIPFDKPNLPLRVTAKHRYRAKEAACTIYPDTADTVKVIFDEPQRAMTPGQAIVFYDSDLVVGGGTILSVD